MVVKSGTKKNFSQKNTKKDKNSYKEYSNKKKVRKQTPPKVGILILDPISKSSEVKN